MHSILAARSDFSVGESILTTKHLVDHAVAAGQKVVALTDTMSVTGMIEFTTAAKKAGIKPIIGTRLRLSADAKWRPSTGQKKKDMPKEYFLTLYALSEDGMKAIFRLLTLANEEPRFYYHSKLDFEDLYAELRAIGKHALAIILGDAHSVLLHPEADQIVDTLDGLVEHLYAPLVPVDTPYFTQMNRLSIEQVMRTEAKPIVVRPAFYGQGEADTKEIMTAISENQKVSDGWFRTAFNRDFHIMSVPDLVNESKQAISRLEQRGIDRAYAVDVFKEGLQNTDVLVAACDYEWVKQPVTLPKMADDEFAGVVAACKAGWAERFRAPVFGHSPTPAELADTYMPRLKYELDVLKRLNFSGYFLLVQDTVQFAKKNGILVGPGRGSVGGSLVAYLMGITECDPLRFGLLFERFINPERIDLPDADLDFMGTRRHEVIDYLKTKYGAARVAGVNNYGTLQAASSIRDVGRVTELPERDYSVSKFAPKNHGANVPLKESAEQVPEIDAFAKKYPLHWDMMTRLEGTVRNFGQHASGFVVSGMDLTERAVVEKRKDSAVVCWDKRIAEDMGLVKVDILGLLTLDVVELVLRYVRERTGARLDLSRIPLDDEKVLKNFAEGKTTGIFQFESGGMRRLLKELGFSGTVTFDDITACTALYRPGPMESGMMDSFYLRKQGNESIDYDHALMKPVLEETFGVIVYQEQVMKISQVIAGYSGAGADKLRKIMGKKLPEEMAKERDKFVQGCVDTIGCLPEWAGKLFDKIEGFAGYGFNKSHSVEYTLISYQSMWLKTYYPVEFYAAALTLSAEEKIPAILRDAKSFGIQVDVPDINNSTDRFEIVTDTRLVMPFQAIKGISANTTNAIIAARKSGEFTDKADFLSRVEKRKCNARHQETLDKIGAFARIEPGQPPSTDPSRIKDQIELLPGLITATVPVQRDLDRTKEAKADISDLVNEFRKAEGPETKGKVGMPVRPTFGKEADFMLIMDAPSHDENSAQMMGFGATGSPVEIGLTEAGLSKIDVYWTALIKKPKTGKQVSPDEVETWRPYLQREIDILKPPVIVLMGTTVVRTFFPDFKGKASEQAGKVVYSKELDANIVIGFNPGEVFYDPDKQVLVNDIFIAVNDLLA